jgi:hypothetical protein
VEGVTEITLSDEWLELTKKGADAKDFAVRYKIKIYEPDDSGVCRIDTVAPNGETITGIIALQDGTLKRAIPFPCRKRRPCSAHRASGIRFGSGLTPKRTNDGQTDARRRRLSGILRQGAMKPRVTLRTD